MGHWHLPINARPNRGAVTSRTNNPQHAGPWAESVNKSLTRRKCAHLQDRGGQKRRRATVLRIGQEDRHTPRKRSTQYSRAFAIASSNALEYWVAQYGPATDFVQISWSVPF